VEAIEVDAGVRLVALEPDRAEELQALVEQNRSWLAAWLGWARDQRLEDSRSFLEACAAKAASGQPPNYGIEVDGRLVGTLGNHGVDRENGSVELGYWLARSHSRRGVVTRCVRRLLDVYFDELKLHRVELRAAPGNGPSRRVAERLGFTYVGTIPQARRFHEHWLDMCLYSMLADEWPAKRAASAGPAPG
jgi:ribosomal-protein-serine acetyltransferase